MKKYGILALGVIVLGVLVVLVVLLRQGSRASQTHRVSSQDARQASDPQALSAGRATTPDKESGPGTSDARTIARSGTIGQPDTAGGPDSLPAGSSSSEGDSTAAGRDYVRPDGIRVRDHRPGDHEPDLTRAIPGPRGRAKLARDTVLALLGAVSPVIQSCASELSRQGLGESPMVRVDAIIGVYDQRLSIDSVAIHARDVPSDVADAITGCATRSLQDIVVPAPGEKDLSSYTVTLPVPL